MIAEVGLNHNGELAIAKQLVDAAVSAGADAVKFQKRKLRETYREEIIDQPRHGEQGLQYIVPLLIEFELSDDEFRELFAYCAASGITAMCTPWDRGSVDFLETCDLAAYKIGSPDLTNFPLIEYVAATGKPMLLSTGMSTEEEVRRTLAFLEQRNAEYALFHCVSTYPAAAEEINLRFMERLREWSRRPVGYSGHDTGTAISLAAVAMGARMLERHLTLDRTMRGPDHKASLEPAQFVEQVRALREVEASIGVPQRWITRGETLNRRVLGKSLVAASDIPAQHHHHSRHAHEQEPRTGPLAAVRRQARRAHARRGRWRATRCSTNPTSKTSSRRVKRPPSTWARRGGSSPAFSISRRSNRPSCRSACASSSSTSATATSMPAPRAIRAAASPSGSWSTRPRYCHDTLIDLCSADDAQRNLSVQRIQKTIDLARDLAPLFEWDKAMFPKGPKIVMHVGGMSPRPGGYDLEGAVDRLLAALRQLDTTGVDLLIENLPPYPWYFGGRWFGHVLCDAENTVMLCKESGLGLCFDTSHAALECAKSGASLLEFAKAVSAVRPAPPHVGRRRAPREKGLQIGDGTVNFVALLPVLLEPQPTIIPEIWMGHHENGLAFRAALERLTEIKWAALVLGRPSDRRTRADLRALTVMHDASVFTALRVIDTNRMGIAFVLDSSRRVVGVVTDGDIRHAFVRGINLHDEVRQAMTKTFVHGTQGMSPAELRALLPGRTRVMPILDAGGRLVDFASIDTLGGETP